MQHDNRMINPALLSELKPGEQLLWWGQPDLARKAKSVSTPTASYITYSILTLASTGLIFNALRLMAEENNLFGRPDSESIVLLLVSIALFGTFAYRLYQLYAMTTKRSNDLRRTLYGITNQRVIVMTARPQGFAVHSYTQQEIGQINRVETGGGWGDVAFGKLRQMQRGLRTFTITEKLLGIPNAQMVEDILVRTFKNGGQEMPQTWNVPPMQPYPQMLLSYEQSPQAQPPESRPRD